MTWRNRPPRSPRPTESVRAVPPATRRRLGRILRTLPSREAPAIPSAADHARLFVSALVALILAGALLLALPIATRDGTATPPVDALFTAVSAACVTGLVTVDTRDHWNGFGQVVILILIQLGGLGFMVGASVLLRSLLSGGAGSGPGLRHTLLLRDSGPTLSLREATQLSARIVRFTFAVEIAGALLLALRFAEDKPVLDALWHAIFLSVSAFCNGSFDLEGGFRSLRSYQTSIWINVVIMGLIQAGALSYVVLSDLLVRRRWRTLAVETRLVLLVHAAAVIFGTAVFLAVEWNGALNGTPAWSRTMIALFQSVAARSGGFATIDWSQTNDITQLAWLSLLFIGGASGSTAGGVKLATIGIIAVAVLSSIRGEQEPRVFNRRIAASLVFRALAVVSLMVIALFGTTLLLAGAERIFNTGAATRPAALAILFESMSALATDGVSTGITPSLSTAGKLVLCGAMIAGRLGPLTVVYALQTRQRAPRYRFPEEPVRIG